MNLFVLDVATDRKIAGNQEWLAARHRRLALPKFEWPFWSDAVAREEPVIDEIGASEQRRFFLIPIRFFFRGMGQLWAAKEEFLAELGEERLERAFFSGRLRWRDGREVEGWRFLLPRPNARVAAGGQLPPECAIGAAAGSPLIVRPDVHAKIAHWSQPGTKWSRCEEGKS